MTALTRRTFLAGSALAGANFSLPISLAGANSVEYELTADAQTISFFPEGDPTTDVWSYGSVPGPVLRVKQGNRITVKLNNRLEDPTTIHWHGLRLDNQMDGVPYLTQAPVTPDTSFTYSFLAKDAGTFWYHPHVNSTEQVGRGLSGVLIVEEENPPDVDRDLVWVLDDWRLQRDGMIAQFGNFHDLSHAGRLGNVATVNGRYDNPLVLTSGERIRLRLVNTANARIFALKFLGHDPWRIAVDGHPVAPQQIGEEAVTLPPGGRVDLIIDATGQPGEKMEIHDVAYPRAAYLLAEIKYDGQEAGQTTRRPAPPTLAENPVLKPDLENAEFHEMSFQGGAMGRLSQAEFKGKVQSLRELASMGMVWAINGKISPPMENDSPGEPMLRLRLGRTYRLRWRNDTSFDHPIHLHGHSFHVVARDGKTVARPEILDTVLIAPGEHVDVAFVADNPGKWALHCHVLEHAKAGMMGYVEVA